MDKSALFVKLGGAPAINAAVDIFYEKMLKDPRVSGFFDHTDMTAQRNKQKRFLAMAFGGPKQYDGRSMRDAHSKLLERGLNDEHVDIVIQHLGDTLKELGVDNELISQVATIANSVRDDVLGRN